MNNIKGLAVLLLALHGSAASASMVITNISADVVAISGNQLPTNVHVGDTVTFSYQYDNSGNSANYYYLDGSVVNVPVSTYPQMVHLSDANATFSQNILATIGEYHGTSGYQTYNYHWAWTDNNGSQIMQSNISPATVVSLGYSSSNPLSLFYEGNMTLWGSDPITNANIWGATVFFDFTSVSTAPFVSTDISPIPAPSPFILLLTGLGLLGLTKRFRKAD